MPFKRNVQVRNEHRTFMNKTIEAVQTFLTDFDPSTVSNAKKLRAWKTTLTEKKITLNKLDSTILEEIQPDRIADEINKTSKFLQELIESLQKLTLHLSRFQDQPTQVGTVNFSLPSKM